RKQLARTGKSGLYLIDDQQNAVLAAELGKLGDEVFGRDDESTLTCNQFQHDARHIFAGDMRTKEFFEVHWLRIPVFIRKGQSVDFGCKRTKPEFVRLDL